MGDWLIHQDLERESHWNGDTTALVFEGDECTYSEFNERVNRLSRALVDADISEGDVVVTHSLNHADLLTVFYACSKAGAVYSPISTFQSDRNIEYIVDRLSPSFAFYSCDDKIVNGRLPTLRTVADSTTFVSLDESSVEADEPIGEFIDGFDPENPEWGSRHDPSTNHNLFWTSGTTGQPKAVIRDHQATMHFADGFVTRLPMHDISRRLIVSNMMFIGPYFRDGITAPMTGGTQYFLRKFDPQSLFESLRRYEINGLQVEFTIANALTEYIERNDEAIMIEYIYAAIKTPELAERLFAISEHLYHLYGQTEAGHPLVHEIEPPFDDRPSLGRPTSHSDIRVVPPSEPRGRIDTDPPEPGQQGELVVRSKGAMTRYLDDDLQQELVHDGWIYTGDLVGIDGDREIYFIDRIDNRLRSGGVNIYPAEIERVLTEYPEVEEAVVIGIEDANWGNRICALVVYSGTRTDEEIIDHLDDFCINHEGVTREMRPREYRIIRSSEKIPTGAVDKVDRVAVESQFFA